jgi:hypothetical protein
MDIKTKKFKEFMFIDIFDIKNGFYNKKPISKGKGNIPFIGATIYHNGITSFHTTAEIDQSSKMGHGKNHDLKSKIFKGNCIVVTNNGSVGYAYYQVANFTCSHDVNPLYLKNHPLNKYLAKFLVGAIEKQRVCFEYARKWRPMRMVKSKILLPATPNGDPDYSFMEAYMKNLESIKIDQYTAYISNRIKELKDFKEVSAPDFVEWGEFFINEVCDILSGKDIYGTERTKGDTPYVSSTANNNGIGHFVGNSNKTKEAGCLSVNRNGSVGYSFYHPYDALFSNDCRKLRLKHPSKHVGIFISQQITRQKGKYGYGYKMGTARLKRQKIMLPITKNGKPDYYYMENYMKKLEYDKLKAYLKAKKLISSM